ncbi:MAG TPA: alpha-amylase family glycosyl hydrolase [Flavobacterium sp.]
MTNKIILSIAAAIAFTGCSAQPKVTSAAKPATPFVWEGASVYFLLTDRFNNGDRSTDVSFGRSETPAVMRGFQGGDIKGIIMKLDEGYFDRLGVNAIWLNPVVEQIHGAVDEGTGVSYGFHGYWTKDWTALDPNYGTRKDLQTLVEKAHARGIRIILDAVINHTGPVTQKDPVWPADWVRTEPQCDYKTFQTTTECTLVKNLPDVKTESNAAVALPGQLVAKWKAEGRYEQEVRELDEFFTRTGYPRAPRYYIIKWLTDYITDFGIDGYRADTVKHTGEDVWAAFETECNYSFDQWKKTNPGKVLDDNQFYTIAEVYNYSISAGRNFDFGDKKVDYFANGFDNMINFEFKWNAKDSYEAIFSRYSDLLNTVLEGYSVLNYISSHDDGDPFDAQRTKSIESANKLLLSPGVAQIYYGDETGRNLIVAGAKGDANLRSFMNWEDVENNTKTKETLLHWQKLGQFRQRHPAIGAGVHKQISSKPYTFSRGFVKDKYLDRVIIGLEMPKGRKVLDVSLVFPDGTWLTDAYSGKDGIVSKGKVTIDSAFETVLLEKK